MQSDTETARVWWVTRDMARITGVCLSQMVVDGGLTREVLAEIMATCGACPFPGRCHAWVSRAEAATEMPGFCPNKTVIEALGAA